MEVSIGPECTRIGAVWEGGLDAREVLEVRSIEGFGLKSAIPLVNRVSRAVTSGKGECDMGGYF